MRPPRVGTRLLVAAVLAASCSTPVSTTTATTTTAPTTTRAPTTTTTTTTAPTTRATTTTTTTRAATTTTTTRAAATTTIPAPTTIPAAGGTIWQGAGGELDLPGRPRLTFAVATETASGVDPDELAAFVDATLTDPRGWPALGFGFHRVPYDRRSPGDVVLVVATPATVDRLCAPLRTNGRFSCGRNGWIALNLDRWNGATSDWPADLTTYRRYLVSHEIGHYLGRAHEPCPGAGHPAPVMMQQTKGLQGCTPNPWPAP